MPLSTVVSEQEELHVLHLQNENINLEHVESQSNQVTTIDDLKWRPAFHINAPSGWLNDPCGLGYDPSTGLYHVSFQWNPKGNDWGNVSWGNSTSYDMVSWKTSPEPRLTPSTDYDRCGIFTGCLEPTDIDGSSGALTCIYTSVKDLPIHFTLPYVHGCESLSLAVSHDGGLTWNRLDCNPILPGPPRHLQVTGWRDPFVGPWRRSTRSSEPASDELYGFISGGIVGETPAVFVYTVNAKDLRDWKFIGCLVDVGLNFRPSRWSGDFGVNWEVANMVDLTDEKDGVSRTFLIVGAEGCNQPESDTITMNGRRTRAQAARLPRQQLWMSLKGKTPISDECNESSSKSTLASYSFAGIFDHGCYYAANSFYDPLTGRHVVYGWVTEEDLPDNLRHAQGWSGVISLPRTVELQVLHNVVGARSSDLQTITSFEKEANSRGTYTVRTLGIRPDDRLKKLRAKATRFTLQNLDLPFNCSVSPVIPLASSRWEGKVRFAVSKKCTRVGIQIAHSAGMYLCSQHRMTTIILILLPRYMSRFGNIYRSFLGSTH
jgi:beta-fructofuranosidase